MLPREERLLLHVSRIRNRAHALKLRGYLSMKKALVAVTVARDLIARAQALRANSSAQSTASSAVGRDLGLAELHSAERRPSTGCKRAS